MLQEIAARLMDIQYLILYQRAAHTILYSNIGWLGMCFFFFFFATLTCHCLKNITCQAAFNLFFDGAKRLLLDCFSFPGYFLGNKLTEFMLPHTVLITKFTWRTNFHVVPVSFKLFSGYHRWVLKSDA